MKLNIKEIIKHLRACLSGSNRSTAVIGTFALLFVANCGEMPDWKKEQSERYRMQNYRCNESQFLSVEREFNICKETGYLDSECLRMAKQAYCDYIWFTSAN